MIKNWFMLGFVKLSFEHYEVNIKKFKSWLLSNSSFSINLIFIYLYNFYCVAVLLDQLVFVDEVWTVSTWTQDAWWKEILCDKGIECIQSSGVPVMNALHCPLMTLTFTIFMAKSLNGHACFLYSHARPFTIPLFFSSGGRGRRVWPPHETTCFHGDLVKDSLS